MPTGTPLTRAHIQDFRNKASLHAAARQRVWRLETDNKQLKAENDKLKKTAQGLQAENEQLREKLQQQTEANQKLRALLFKRDHPHRTRRAQSNTPRTAASYRRQQPGVITERQELVLESCPDCGTAVSAPQSSRTRIVEDIVFHPQPQAVEWTIHRHYCSNCRRLVEGIVPGVLPKMTLGPNTLTYVVLAKYRWNLPYAKIQDNLIVSFGLTISEGEIANLIERAAQLVGAKWQEIIKAIKSGHTIHCDETGWYINGTKVWAHAFATDYAVVYEIMPTRGKGVAENMLAGFTGTRVTDCLPNYKNLSGSHQICWAHLTREAQENARREPGTQERQHLQRVVDTIYAELRVATSQWEPGDAAHTKRSCEQRVAALVDRRWEDERCRILVNRLQDFHSALFTCLSAPGIPPDNNHAERVIRKIVVQRKISGGNRSPTHALYHAKLMSVIETLRLEGGSLLPKLQAVLRQGMAVQLSGQ